MQHRKAGKAERWQLRPTQATGKGAGSVCLLPRAKICVHSTASEGLGQEDTLWTQLA